MTTSVHPSLLPGILATEKQLVQRLTDSARDAGVALVRNQPDASTERRVDLLVAATKRRITDACPHPMGVAALAEGVTWVVDLTAHWLACQQCAPAWYDELSTTAEDDGLCDVCDVAPPDNQFTPFTVASGGVVFAGHACDTCKTTLFTATPAEE